MTLGLDVRLEEVVDEEVRVLIGHSRELFVSVRGEGGGLGSQEKGCDGHPLENKGVPPVGFKPAKPIGYPEERG